MASISARLMSRLIEDKLVVLAVILATVVMMLAVGSTG
jgi:hypothetical protein